jgi:protein-tyrosine kinase
MDRLSKALEKARSDRELVGQPARQSSSINSRQFELPDASAFPEAAIRSVDAGFLEAHRVLVDGANGPALSAFKLLRTQVLHRMLANGWQTLVVTSPSQGNGKTVTAINLSINLARQAHQSVLLVDLDLRRPAIHRYLCDAPAPGISDYIYGGARLEEILFNPGIDGLTVLPGRAAVSHSSEALLREETVRLMRELRAHYAGSLIILDMPPVLSVDDVVAFSAHWDAALLVVEEGHNTDRDVRDALDLLKAKPVLGTVLTKSEDAPSDYDY